MSNQSLGKEFEEVVARGGVVWLHPDMLAALKQLGVEFVRGDGGTGPLEYKGVRFTVSKLVPPDTLVALNPSSLVDGLWLDDEDRDKESLKEWL
jgi:hypothetical protein